jgi:hypothetical protein
MSSDKPIKLTIFSNRRNQNHPSIPYYKKENSIRVSSNAAYF